MKIVSSVFSILGMILFALLVYFQALTSYRGSAEGLAETGNKPDTAASGVSEITLISDVNCRASVLVNGVVKAVFKEGEAKIYAGKHDTVEILAPKNELCHVKVKSAKADIPPYMFDIGAYINRRDIIFKVK